MKPTLVNLSNLTKKLNTDMTDKPHIKNIDKFIRKLEDLLNATKNNVLFINNS